MKKIHPNQVAEAALIGVETNSVYFNPPEIA